MVPNPLCESPTDNHIAVHSDGREWKHRGEHGGTLQQGHHVTQGPPEGPAVAGERVRHGERNAAQAHQQVPSGQVTDEEVGGVVELLVHQNAEQQEGVPHTSHHHDEAVERQEDGFETQEQLHAHERVQGVALVDSLGFEVLQSFQSQFISGVADQCEILTCDIHTSPARAWGTAWSAMNWAKKHVTELKTTILNAKIPHSSLHSLWPS